MSHGNHLKHMLYGGVAIFAVLAVSGVPLSTALTYGVLLACPLMMIAMMLTMGGHGEGGQHGTGRSDASSDAAARHDRRFEPDPVELERR